LSFAWKYVLCTARWLSFVKFGKMFNFRYRRVKSGGSLERVGCCFVYVEWPLWWPGCLVFGSKSSVWKCKAV